MKKLSAFIILLILSSHPSLYPGRNRIIAIQSLGHVDENVLSLIERGITAMYNADVIILEKRGLPPGAYYRPGKRYRAEKLIRYLDRVTVGKYTKVVGITARDISTTKGKFADWGIFGLGSLGGKSCVVSTFRLRRGKKGRRMFSQRLIKVVNHELGHTFGIGHCPVKNCLMQDARGTIVSIDGEPGGFCNLCREKLKEIIRGNGSN